jgi:hypothetical protein
MRAQAVFNRIAASGRYFNTGKVLIGLTYARAPRAMSRDEETLQALLLRWQQTIPRHEKAQ